MDFYYTLASPPCRAPLLTARALGVKVNLQKLELRKQEHLKPSFVAINPQHCVPTIVDGDFVLWESNAICCYLVNQYGKDDSLYPRSPKQRALVDKLLYFNMGILSKKWSDYAVPTLHHGLSPEADKLEALQSALGFLNTALSGTSYVAGDTATVADHAVVATVSTIEAAGVNLSGHPLVVTWLARCKASLPGYEENEVGAKIYGEAFKSRMPQK